MAEEELIRGCLRHEPASQRELYLQFFNTAMNMCVRYSKNQEEAKAILVDAFKNIFNGFGRYEELNAKQKKDAPSVTLEEWVKQEVIASAIRHLHANKKEHFVSSTVSVRESEKQAGTERTDEQIIKAANPGLIIKALQQLKPSLRVIYNLHEVDGCTHAEISKLMDISEYISRDSLSKARFNIRKYLSAMMPAPTP